MFSEQMKKSKDDAKRHTIVQQVAKTTAVVASSNPSGGTHFVVLIPSELTCLPKHVHETFLLTLRSERTKDTWQNIGRLAPCEVEQRVSKIAV